MSLTEYKVEAKVFVIDKTDVSIKKEYPYTFIRRSLPGDWTDKSDEAIINAVLEIVNTEFDPTSAIAKFTLLQNEMKQTIEHTKKNSEIGQKALLDLAGKFIEAVTDIEMLKAAVFGEGHEAEEEHSETPTTPTAVVPTAPEAPTATVPETTAQPVAPTIPAETITTSNLNMEVEHNESTETSIPQGQPTGFSSENTTSTITGI